MSQPPREPTAPLQGGPLQRPWAPHVGFVMWFLTRNQTELAKGSPGLSPGPDRHRDLHLGCLSFHANPAAVLVPGERLASSVLFLEGEGA